MCYMLTLNLAFTPHILPCAVYVHCVHLCGSAALVSPRWPQQSTTGRVA